MRIKPNEIAKTEKGSKKKKFYKICQPKYNTCCQREWSTHSRLLRDWGVRKCASDGRVRGRRTNDTWRSEIVIFVLATVVVASVHTHIYQCAFCAGLIQWATIIFGAHLNDFVKNYQRTTIY